MNFVSSRTKQRTDNLFQEFLGQLAEHLLRTDGQRTFQGTRDNLIREVHDTHHINNARRAEQISHGLVAALQARGAQYGLAFESPQVKHGQKPTIKVWVPVRVTSRM